MQQLNIKNQETYRLAQELSRLTGENVTIAVTRALEERIDKIKNAKIKNRQGIADKLLAIGDRCRALPIQDDRSPDSILYDENGLPLEYQP